MKNGNKKLKKWFGNFPIFRGKRRLSKDEIKALHDIYGVLWCEAYYDCYNNDTRRFAKPLSDKMSKLNETLKFKL